MKGLRKFIAPFAPDQSGACAVLCELGGMVIILDAGGCAGNICGFDEPRWFGSRSAIFSAGLRDMDAILGRDDRLVEKIEKACRRLSCSFIAVIGTPVPSVIGTDYRALKRMIEKKTGLPVITVDTNGMELYDAGIKKALKTVFLTFAKRTPGTAVISQSVGILGVTPLDLTLPSGSWDLKRQLESRKESTSVVPFIEGGSSQAGYVTLLKEHYMKKGYRNIFPFGLGTSVTDMEKAARVEMNLVVSPAALDTARYLRDTFGTPFKTDYPLETLPGWEDIAARLSGLSGSRILIVHQQILANALRDHLIKAYCEPSDITVASWFDMDKEYLMKQDIHIREEDQWISLVKEGNYDCIIGDALFRSAVKDYSGAWIDIDHFAVSGRR